MTWSRAGARLWGGVAGSRGCVWAQGGFWARACPRGQAQGDPTRNPRRQRLDNGPTPAARRRRFQSQLPGQQRFTRVFPSLALIAREEGWRALYRGFVPKALRLGIGQSVGLVTFQVTAARLYARSST